MRTKIDINSNQCEKCFKIQKEGRLYYCDLEGDYEGISICYDCYKKLRLESEGAI